MGLWYTPLPVILHGSSIPPVSPRGQAGAYTGGLPGQTMSGCGNLDAAGVCRPRHRGAGTYTILHSRAATAAAGSWGRAARDGGCDNPPEFRSAKFRR
jgi:hypothetical protein